MMSVFYRCTWKRSYSYRVALQISVHVFPLTIYDPIWQCRCTNCFLALFVELFLSFFFVEDGCFLDTGVLQLEVFFHLINVLDIRMAVDYRKFIALQSDICNLLFSPIAFSSVCFFFIIYFVLEDGSSYSWLAWNAFCFSIKLFMMMFLLYSSFFRVRFYNLNVTIVVINSFFSL